jgi:hypothetical protein
MYTCDSRPDGIVVLDFGGQYCHLIARRARGHQLIALLNGGEVQRGERREYGVTDVVIDRAEGVLRGLADVERVWMSHGDIVYTVPDEFNVLAHTDISPVAAYRHARVREDKLNILRRADAIVRAEVEASGLSKEVWMYFAMLTDTKSTGVKGDERAYGWTVAVRIIDSLDGMTASFRKVSWDLLERLSTRITNDVPAVTRVVYDVTHKPPSTIEWE